MNAAVFPIVGSLVVLLVVLPISAALAKLCLLLLEREESGGPLHGFNLRYLVLIGSSAVPLTWFISAGVHQSEPGRSPLACALDHGARALCVEPGVFAGALVLGTLGVLARVSRGALHREAATDDATSLLRARIASLLQDKPAFHGLSGRIVVCDTPGFAAATEGLLRPRVVIGTTFATSLTDPMLIGALAHEREHVRGFDPLRFLLLDLALAVNPVGRRLLGPHAERWRIAREAHCDREAVMSGAPPLALADAIVKAARPCAPAVPLSSTTVGVLRLRVGLLLAFAERAPTPCCRRSRSAFPAVMLLLLVALLLPHHAGTYALDLLHIGAERALRQPSP